MMQVQDIEEYVANQPTIRVRVCRLWKHIIQSSDQCIKSFDAVFVDKEGYAIHSTMPAKKIAHFSSILEVGKVYDISEYYAENNKKLSTVVQHRCQLRLTSRTKIQEFTGDTSTFPKHGFSLVNYNFFRTRTDPNFQYLTDIIGRVKVVYATQQVVCNWDSEPREEHKKDIDLEDFEGNEWTVTLWGHVARSFDQQTVSELNGPCIMVFTSTRIKDFNKKIGANSTTSTVMFINPQIREAQPYYQIFAGPQFKVQLAGAPMPSTPTPQLLMEQPKTTIKQFLEMNPDKYRNVKFVCQATVTDVTFGSISHGLSWCYYGCPTCAASLKAENKSECEKHGKPIEGPRAWYILQCDVADDTEDGTFRLMGKAADTIIKPSAHVLVKELKRSSNVIPQEANMLIGKTFLFQLNWGSPKIDGTKSDLIVSTVHDIAKIAKLPNAAKPSTIPLPLSQDTSPLHQTTSASVVPTPSSIEQLPPPPPVDTKAKRKLSYMTDSKDP